MPISPELVAAKESLEPLVFALPGVTGIDIGVADDDEPDFDNLVIRVFVSDLSSIPEGIPSDVDGFPVVVRERRYEIQQLSNPDISTYRPIVGGSSIGPERVLNSPAPPHFGSGTLGAIVRDAGGAQVFGLSNFHVLANDPSRQRGDNVIQPEASSVLGVLPGSRVGALERWAFPESVPAGEVDAAICTLDVSTVAAASVAVREIGLVNGTSPPKVGMAVRKRGRTTGLTFGTIFGCEQSHKIDVPNFGFKTFRRQMEVKVDFPQSLFWSERGDSGSVVVNGLNQAVGLFFAAWDREQDGLPQWGLANPIDAVEQELGISFSWPQPLIDVVVPVAISPVTVVLIVGNGFLLASSVRFGEIESAFEVVDDRQINAVVPFGSGTVPISVDGPGGTGIGGSFTF